MTLLCRHAAPPLPAPCHPAIFNPNEILRYYLLDVIIDKDHLAEHFYIN
jgi:hypothetical protein